jgi:hypothetical protein
VAKKSKDTVDPDADEYNSKKKDDGKSNQTIGGNSGDIANKSGDAANADADEYNAKKDDDGKSKRTIGGNSGAP